MGKFTKSNFLKLSKEALDFQLKALYPLHVEKEAQRINLLFLNHDRNFSSFLTIEYLLKHERVADIYTISRTIFESVISMGLLSKKLIANDLNRYQDYQFTEIYKTYSHLKRLGLERTSGVPDKQVNFLEKKRNDYINKYGKNLSTWTGHSLENNIKLIDQNYQPTCNEDHFYEYLYCQVYRKGSQAAHSSFAGLSKGVEVEKLNIPGATSVQRLKSSEPHLIFACFHSLIVFLSSVRFLGALLKKKETEDYFHSVSKYIISEN